MKTGRIPRLAIPHSALTTATRLYVSGAENYLVCCWSNMHPVLRSRQTLVHWLHSFSCKVSAQQHASTTKSRLSTSTNPSPLQICYRAIKLLASKHPKTGCSTIW